MRLLLKKAGFSGLWYLLGCATPFVVAMVCVVLEVGPLPWQAINCWERWRVEEEQSGHLVIHSWREGEWSAGIWRDPGTDVLERVSFERGGIGIIFDYRTHGICSESVPQAVYFGGRNDVDGVMWADFNGDGWFDKRFIMGESKLEVPVSGKWVQVHTSDSNTETLKTEEGVELEFDVESGEWKPVAPSGTSK